MPTEIQTVTQDEADIRLDRWLRRHHPGLQQSLIQKLCRTGQIRVDGARAGTNTRLTPGQSIRIPPMGAPAVPRTVSRIDPYDAKELQSALIYQDDHVLVINKPYGLPVQGGPGITRHLDGMLDALRFGSEHRPRLVHRLDRDTTGVLLLARTPGTAGKLAALFRGRDIDKTYWAVVAGRPVPVEGRIDLPLKRVGGARGERTAPADRDDPDGARAITDYQTLDQCRPEAGLAGTEAAHRPHPSASRALRRYQGSDPRRRKIRGTRPEHGIFRADRGPVQRSSLTRQKADSAASGGGHPDCRG